MPQLIKPQMAADLLAISPNTLAFWRTRPEEGPGLPFVRLGPRCVRYRLSDIETLIEKKVQS